MEKQVLQTIKRFSLLENGNHITVALSGGADSMALLYVLLSLREKLGITVAAAHLNHGIRGKEADRDEQFVKTQCEKLGVECFCEYADIPKIACELGISTELAARQVRYSFLERVAPQLIATAHNADDNLETVIFNLTRGTALDGLCGIPPKRDRIIRPALLCTRVVIEEYCSKNKIAFVTDSTNLSDDYTRNKIRHNIIPKLYEINANVQNCVLRTTQSLREDANTLYSLAENYISENVSGQELSLENFSKLDSAVAKRVLKKFTENTLLGVSLESVHIESLLNVAINGGRTSLPEDYTAVVRDNKLMFKKMSETPLKKQFKVCFTEKNNNFFEKEKKVNNLLLKNSLDCDKIVGKSVVRTRRAGDKIRLANRGCTKTLKDIYSECKIPAHLRETLPVIADDEGVIWIHGIGVAQRCAVTPQTKRIYVVDVEEVN